MQRLRARERLLPIVMFSALVATACSSGGGDRVGDGGAVTTTGSDSGSGSDPAPSSAAGISLELSAGELSQVALGEAIPLTIDVVNAASKSASVDLRVSVSDPAGKSIDAVETSVFASHDDTVSSVIPITPSQWFAELGTYQLTVAALEAPAIAPATLSIEVVAAPVTIPVFEDVTAAAGLTTRVPDAGCGQFSNGAGFADIDFDGDLDLLVTRLEEPVQLFVNDGTGQFDDQTAERGIVATSANGVGFADYDNDGDQDVMIVTDGADQLYSNDGSGRFADVSAQAGIGLDDTARGMDVAWGDYDNDGNVDAYVTNYMHCTGEWTTEAEIVANVEYYRDVLYHNEGDGTFTDATALIEGDIDDYDDGSTIGAGFGAAWFDYDDDGLVDLYLGNDFVGPSPDSNRLWHNDGATRATDAGWSFTDVSLDSGTALYMNTMGIGVTDIDRDGDLDMALSNVGASKLLRNAGDGTFVDDLTSGIGRAAPQAGYLSIAWGTVFADFNLDGWDDLYQGAGNFMQPPDVVVGEQPNIVYVSDGTGRTFLDVSAATGANSTADSKGVAVADFDSDGRLDVFVVNQDGSPTLFRNVTPLDGMHWMGVRLQGTDSNRDGCGATVTVELADASLVEPMLCGSGGGGSGNAPLVHFGLGAATDVQRVVVDWPSGHQQIVEGLAIDHYLTIEEHTP